MKHASTYARRFPAFAKRLKRYDAAPFAPLDPVTQVVVGFLQWNATRKAADAAHERIARVLVDNNELRVSNPREVMSLLGARYPQAQERAERLQDVLQVIFEREHAVSLASLEKESRKEVRHYLDSLPGMVPYVSAQVFLLNFGGLAAPVDDVTARLLKAQDLADADADPAAIAAFLEKQVKAEDAADFHRQLRAWADRHYDQAQVAAAPPPATADAAVPAAGRPARRPSRR